jgi:hypothetical protein
MGAHGRPPKSVPIFNIYNFYKNHTPKPIINYFVGCLFIRTQIKCLTEYNLSHSDKSNPNATVSRKYLFNGFLVLILILLMGLKGKTTFASAFGVCTEHISTVHFVPEHIPRTWLFH